MIYSYAGAPESDFQTTLHSVCRIYNDYDYFVDLEEGNKPSPPSKITSASPSQYYFKTTASPPSFVKIPYSHALEKNLVIRIPKRRQNNVADPWISPCISVENVHYTVVFLTCVCLLSMPFVAVMR
jgi:hypothetical protein